MNIPQPNDVWQREEIESPCVKLCLMHPEEKICVGCLRTMEEIRHWSDYEPQQRRDVMAQLSSRRPHLQKRRGGRRART